MLCTTQGRGQPKTDARPAVHPSCMSPTNRGHRRNLGINASTCGYTAPLPSVDNLQNFTLQNRKQFGQVCPSLAALPQKGFCDGTLMGMRRTRVHGNVLRRVTQALVGIVASQALLRKVNRSQLFDSEIEEMRSVFMAHRLTLLFFPIHACSLMCAHACLSFRSHVIISLTFQTHMPMMHV